MIPVCALDRATSSGSARRGVVPCCWLRETESSDLLSSPPTTTRRALSTDRRRAQNATSVCDRAEPLQRLPSHSDRPHQFAEHRRPPARFDARDGLLCAPACGTKDFQEVVRLNACGLCNVSTSLLPARLCTHPGSSGWIRLRAALDNPRRPEEERRYNHPGRKPTMGFLAQRENQPTTLYSSAPPPTVTSFLPAAPLNPLSTLPLILSIAPFQSSSRAWTVFHWSAVKDDEVGETRVM